MDTSPRPLSQQLGIIVVMLTTAIAAGIAIGWLLSPRLPSGTSQEANTPAPIADDLQDQGADTTLAAAESATPAIAATTVVAVALPTATVEPTNAPTSQPTAIPTEQPTATIEPPTPTPEPTAIPTERPTATATIEPPTPTTAPTSVPTPIPAATAASTPTRPIPTGTAENPAVALLQQVATAEAALRSGELDAILDYGEGTRSSAQVRFDFGDTQRPPSLDFRTTYQGAANSQTVETILIGDQAWERQGNESWNTVAPRRGLWDQVQFFLPRASVGSDPQMSRQANQIELRWYDASRDADVMLSLDPDAATPRQLQRRTRSTNLVLTVTYQRWNTPVEIRPPSGT